ncbi:MAG TPA: hypothetical protein O0X33_01695 [Methanocorpusculum sp.]|nr:hypothetical protein [Methanocorpusculum sp.]HJK13153.1 hypothetical protein [Methanocorpusculum sp.]HJK36459.1 hypothetical protein [Methanocorpusculum sp.]HJK37582.1 hypothetical protein [Methanocorpusculum sp.]
MKKITYFLIALLLCAAFVGTVSAWQSNTEAVITPSGNLVPGESVIATMNVVLGRGELDITDSLQFTTPLESATWTVDVYRGGKSSDDDTTKTTVLTYSGKYCNLDGFTLSYNEVIEIVVTLQGVVSDDSKGKEIHIISAQQIPAGGTKSTYESPAQTVYDPDNIPVQIEQMNTAINTLDSQITELSKLGADVSAAISKLEIARNDLNSAESHKSDVSTASRELASASAALVNAEKDLVNAALTKTKSNLDAIDQNIANLNAKGWNDNRVILLSTSKETAQNLYNTAKSMYDSSTSSVPSSLKSQALEVLNKSTSTLETSNALWEEAQKSPLDMVGPYAMYIVIGVVAVLVIVGAIIVIRRRNENDWDELG